MSHRSQIGIPFSKWRISNISVMQFWKPHNFRETLYSEAFGVADYEFDIEFLQFKLADPIWRTQYFGNPTIFVGLYSQAFGVADNEFDIGFQFFEMADPLSRTWNFGNSTIFAQLCTRGFSGSLITNFKLDFQNSTDFELILMRYSVCFLFYLIT